MICLGKDGRGERVVRLPTAGAKPELSPRAPPLLQLRVLRLRLFQDGDVGVGIFPEGEEVLIDCARPTCPDALLHEAFQCSARLCDLGQARTGIVKVREELLVFVDRLVTLARALIP
jgi:hypothetical protein